MRHAISAVGGTKKTSIKVSVWIAEFLIPYELLNPLPKVPPVSVIKWRAKMYRIDYYKDTSHFAWKKTGRSFHE